MLFKRKSLYLFLLFFCSNSYAFDVVEAPDDITNSYLNYQGIEPIEAKSGALDWRIFDTVEENTIKNIDTDGIENIFIEPKYSEEIKKLDGKKIKLYGFMFPLSEGAKQQNFLFGAFPLSCPYHYHVSPKMVVEVFTENPIKFSLDPILIEGTLQVKYNIETQVFYYLNDAELK